MSTIDLLKSVLISLALTVLLELIFAKAVKFPSLRLIIGANLLTNTPLVCLCLLLPLYTGISKVMLLAVLEVCAVLIEWWVYKNHTSFSHPLFFSIGANCFSFFIGELMQILI